MLPSYQTRPEESLANLDPPLEDVAGVDDNNAFQGGIDLNMEPPVEDGHTANMNRAHQRSTISNSSSELAMLKDCLILGSQLCDMKKDIMMFGLPPGFKFAPSDQELIENLQAVVNEGGATAHPLIHHLIPTIQGEDGICYTHPENLPGVNKDGLSKHFFYKPTKAYTTASTKRRKIQAERGLHGSEDVSEARWRWHKTGKTQPVIIDGQQKGSKKILVLYTNFGKNRKPERTNWVMHQYPLGSDEDEGGLVVSKIFYQTTIAGGPGRTAKEDGLNSHV